MTPEQWCEQAEEYLEPGPFIGESARERLTQAVAAIRAVLAEHSGSNGKAWRQGIETTICHGCGHFRGPDGCPTVAALTNALNRASATHTGAVFPAGPRGPDGAVFPAGPVS